MKLYIPNNIFERRNTSQQYLEYVEKVKNDLNINSLKKWRINVFKFFTIHNFDMYVSYAFSLIREWINKNEVYSEKYIDGLEKNLKKLNIYNQLNSLEEEYINHFRSVLFAKKRNLKNLIVDFPLEKIKKYSKLFDRYFESNENVYFHFENSNFYYYEKGIKKYHGKNINIFISDIRIIIDEITQIAPSFYLKLINSYKLGKDSFEFEYAGIKYYIDTEDNYVFYVAFERIKNLFANELIKTSED